MSADLFADSPGETSSIFSKPPPTKEVESPAALPSFSKSVSATAAADGTIYSCRAKASTADASGAKLNDFGELSVVCVRQNGQTVILVVNSGKQALCAISCDEKVEWNVSESNRCSAVDGKGNRWSLDFGSRADCAIFTCAAHRRRIGKNVFASVGSSSGCSSVFECIEFDFGCIPVAGASKVYSKEGDSPTEVRAALSKCGSGVCVVVNISESVCCFASMNPVSRQPSVSSDTKSATDHSESTQKVSASPVADSPSAAQTVSAPASKNASPAVASCPVSSDFSSLVCDMHQGFDEVESIIKSLFSEKSGLEFVRLSNSRLLSEVRRAVDESSKKDDILRSKDQQIEDMNGVIHERDECASLLKRVNDVRESVIVEDKGFGSVDCSIESLEKEKNSVEVELRKSSENEARSISDLRQSYEASKKKANELFESDISSLRNSLSLISAERDRLKSSFASLESANLSLSSESAASPEEEKSIEELKSSVLNSVSSTVRQIAVEVIEMIESNFSGAEEYGGDIIVKAFGRAMQTAANEALNGGDDGVDEEEDGGGDDGTADGA